MWLIEVFNVFSRSQNDWIVGEIGIKTWLLYTFFWFFFVLFFWFIFVIVYIWSFPIILFGLWTNRELSLIPIKKQSVKFSNSVSNDINHWRLESLLPFICACLICIHSSSTLMFLNCLSLFHWRPKYKAPFL